VHHNSLSTSDGQFADAVAAFFDDDDRPGQQFGARLIQHGSQTFDDVLRSRVVETEEDDADHLPGRTREDLAEIEVERQHDPLLGEALLEDVAIRQSLQPLVAKVNRVVAGRA
jgi:hypothetical protein